MFMQRFIRLSRTYKLGHIAIERDTKIAFSALEGNARQFVKAINYSAKKVYLKKIITHF